MKNHRYIIEQTRKGLNKKREGKADQAIQIFKSILELDPNNILGLYVLGILQKEQGKYKNLTIHFEQIINLDFFTSNEVDHSDISENKKIQILKNRETAISSFVHNLKSRMDGISFRLHVFSRSKYSFTEVNFEKSLSKA